MTAVNPCVSFSKQYNVFSWLGSIRSGGNDNVIMAVYLPNTGYRRIYVLISAVLVDISKPQRMRHAYHRAVEAWG
jgi:hypothetical protein